MKKGLPNQAIPHFLDAIDRLDASELALGLYHLAVAYDQLGKREEAIAALRKGLGAAPEFAERGDAQALLERLTDIAAPID